MYYLMAVAVPNISDIIVYLDNIGVIIERDYSRSWYRLDIASSVITELAVIGGCEGVCFLELYSEESVDVNIFNELIKMLNNNGFDVKPNHIVFYRKYVSAPTSKE